MSDSHMFLLAGGDGMYIKGNCFTDDDGSVNFSVAAGETRQMRFSFALPRSATAGIGSILRNVAAVLRVSSGTLASITATLTREVHTNLANQSSTSVTLGTPSPVFVLVPNGTASNFNRNVASVTSPTIDNQSDATSVTYIFQLAFVGSVEAQVEVHGIDVQYGYAAGSADGGVSVPTRYGLEEKFEQLADLNANVANSNVNKNFEVEGVNAAASTLYSGGGIELTTTTTSGDQCILRPHLDAAQSAWRITNWPTSMSLEWNAKIIIGSVTTAIAWAGLKLTVTPVVATDNDAAYFRYSSAELAGNWQAVDSIGGVDTVTDTGVVVAVSTLYRLRVSIDSSRVARFYINDVLVRTTSALTSTNLIPVIGVESIGGADNIRVLGTSLSRLIL